MEKHSSSNACREEVRPKGNSDEYYNRPEVSNSDLTELKNLLHPRMQFGDKEAAFRFGTLVDAIITEPARVNYYQFTVDDVQYTEEEFCHARQQAFEYGGFPFHLDTRCKWDWFLSDFNFGGDLKTTFASSQKQFEEAVDFFDWDRSRAWYMDIAHSNRDFIYAISKKNGCVFKKFINRYDEIYRRGREKYEELAFHYWCLNL